MGEFLDKLLGLSTEEVSQVCGNWPVQDSTELARIEGLPRRTEFALWERECLLPLFPIQRAALGEAQKLRGLFAPIGCGEGKTIISLLLPTVLDVKRAVLLIPAAMEPQLFSEWDRFKSAFPFPTLKRPCQDDDGPGLFVVRYEALSSQSAAQVLDVIRPELIIADECHRLKIRTSSRTKRFLRFFKEHPETLFCGMSGTITSKSIKDFAHLVKLALREQAPVPLIWPVLNEWSEALDVDVELPRPPGELMRFCGDGEEARDGFRRRLVESPGVVASNKNNVSASLVIAKRAPAVPDVVKRALSDLRNTWVLPSGEEISDALMFSRKARELSCGFFYVWDWGQAGPDFEWLEARSEWSREVRAYLHYHSRPGMDSEGLLENAAADGRWKSVTWDRWSGVSDRRAPPVRAVWLSDFLIEDAIDFEQEHEPVVLWYLHDAVGEKLAEEGGYPLYAGGNNSSRLLLTETGGRSIVASVNAHGQGKNLQAWSRQLLLSPTSNGLKFEQLLARCHREGQKAEEVWMYINQHTSECRVALATAIKEAEYQQQIEGVPKRLCYANYR